MRTYKNGLFTSDWVTANTRTWLTHVAPLLGSRAVKWLEIGSYEGRSALWTLENLLPAESTITCVDHFDADYECRFDANVTDNARIVKAKGRSRDVLATLEPGFVGAYVDGSHEEADVLDDARAARRLLIPGGVLVFDDYGMPGPHAAIDRFLAETSDANDDMKVIFCAYQLIAVVS